MKPLLNRPCDRSANGQFQNDSRSDDWETQHPGNSPGTSQPVEETASITTPASETSTLEGEKAAEATPSVQPESSEKQAEEKKRIEETVEQPAATADKEGKMRKTLKNNLFNRS